jgi:hypothetical protein
LPCPDFCVLIMIYLSPEPPQIPFTSFTGWYEAATITVHND